MIKKHKFYFLLLSVLVLSFKVTAQSNHETEYTEIIQFNVFTNTASKMIEGFQLLQSKKIEENTPFSNHAENLEGFIQFEITDAERKVLYSVIQDNPCFINYEYANEKGELGWYRNLVNQATMLVKLPVLKNAAALNLYQIDVEGNRIFISSLTNQNSSWK